MIRRARAAVDSLGRRLLQRTWATAILIAVASGTALPPAMAENLQVTTSVVSIVVPASAYDPATAQAVVTVTRGIVAQVNTNKQWSLQMRATSANFVFTPRSGPRVTKPVSDLQIRDSVAGSRFVPSLSFTTVDSGKNTHGRWESSTFDVIFQVAAADDPAGTYSVILEFQVI